MIALSSDRRITRLAACALATLLSAGCAPDSVRHNASGFDAYVKKLGEVCRPLQIGDKDVGEMIRRSAASTPYDYFLDSTSRLYYKRITPAAYREALVSFFGQGTMDDGSFDCIVRNLPPGRPSTSN